MPPRKLGPYAQTVAVKVGPLAHSAADKVTPVAGSAADKIAPLATQAYDKVSAIRTAGEGGKVGPYAQTAADKVVPVARERQSAVGGEGGRSTTPLQEDVRTTCCTRLTEVLSAGRPAPGGTQSR